MNYEEEYYKLRDLLKRFYVASSAIDTQFCSEVKTITGEQYEKHMDVFIEVEEYFWIDFNKLSNE